MLVLSEDDERARLVALPRAGGPARTLLSVRDSDLVDGDRLLQVEGIATTTTDEEPTDAGPVRAQSLDASG